MQRNLPGRNCDRLDRSPGCWGSQQLEEATKVIGSANPMGRGGRVEDIANAVCFRFD